MKTKEFKNMTRKEQIIFLVKKQGMKTYEEIAKTLKINTKLVRDHVWCIQFREGIWLGF